MGDNPSAHDGGRSILVLLHRVRANLHPDSRFGMGRCVYKHRGCCSRLFPIRTGRPFNSKVRIGDGESIRAVHDIAAGTLDRSFLFCNLVCRVRSTASGIAIIELDSRFTTCGGKRCHGPPRQSLEGRHFPGSILDSGATFEARSRNYCGKINGGSGFESPRNVFVLGQ